MLASQGLSSSGFAIIDHFLGAALALGLREQSSRLCRQQPEAFRSGLVGGGHDGNGDRYSHRSVRGDKMTILETNDPQLPVLGVLCSQFDTLVQCLAKGCSELLAVEKRSRPMLAYYPSDGARYMRHVDNPDGNGRLLTTIYYLNSKWTEGDGGCLRLFRGDDGGELACIAPLLDRVVCFWSDSRVPHEVLPSHGERMAISVWFHAREVKRTAPADPSRMTGLQASKETANLAVLAVAANSLRKQAWVKLHDQELHDAVQLQQDLKNTPCGILAWVSAPKIEGKIKTLLHQLAPSSYFWTGCTKLFLAKGVGAGTPLWLKKPRGAKALVLSSLRGDHVSTSSSVSVHSRRCTVRADGQAPGWPRVADQPVIVDSAGALHVFDCGYPLNVRLDDANVVGMWSFGAIDGTEEMVRNREEEAELVPDL